MRARKQKKLTPAQRRALADLLAAGGAIDEMVMFRQLRHGIATMNARSLVTERLRAKDPEERAQLDAKRLVTFRDGMYAITEAGAAALAEAE